MEFVGDSGRILTLRYGWTDHGGMAKQIWSNNPLERLNKEIKRRTNIVGIFPHPDSIIRLVGSVLSEQRDEWQVSKRYFSAEWLAKVTGRFEEIPLPQAATR